MLICTHPIYAFFFRILRKAQKEGKVRRNDQKLQNDRFTSAAYEQIKNESEKKKKKNVIY